MTPPATIVNHLRAAVGSSAGGPGDHDLIARFAVSRDEAAFELLVWRHAGMVLRTCRGVLRDHQSAEDAAQATFLALARQASAVGRRGTVAGWLYRVARRIAGRAARRSRLATTPVGELDRLPGPAAAPESDLAVRLLAELDRLPDKYRAPVLLCFFDGLSHADAAQRLGWPVGTVAGRLARAKDRLRRRLGEYRTAGVFAAGVVTPAFAGSTTRAAMAFVAKDLGSLSPAVLQLARREVQSMLATKLQWATALTLCGVLTVGGVWAAGQIRGGGDPGTKAPSGGGPPPPKEADADLAKQLAENRKLLAEFEQLTRDFVALQAFRNETAMDVKSAKVDGERLKKMVDEWLTPWNKKLRNELGLAAGKPIPTPEGVEAGGEAKKFDGEWKVVMLRSDGRAATADQMKGMRWSIQGGEIKGTDPDGSTGRFLFRLNPRATPKEIELIQDGRNGMPGIYRLEKDRLEICFDSRGSQKRPTEFAAGTGVSMIVLERLPAGGR